MKFFKDTPAVLLSWTHANIFAVEAAEEGLDTCQEAGEVAALAQTASKLIAGKSKLPAAGKGKHVMYVGCMHILYCYVENQTQNLDLNNIFYFCLEYKQVLWYTIHDDFLSFLHVHIGTDQFLTEHPRLIQQCIQSDQPEQPSPCKKDTGQRSRLRHWSRGHVFVCRPCGHIDFSQPIYKLVHYVLHARIYVMLLFLF